MLGELRKAARRMKVSVKRQQQEESLLPGRPFDRSSLREANRVGCSSSPGKRASSTYRTPPTRLDPTGRQAGKPTKSRLLVQRAESKAGRFLLAASSAHVRGWLRATIRAVETLRRPPRRLVRSAPVSLNRQRLHVGGQGRVRRDGASSGKIPIRSLGSLQLEEEEAEVEGSKQLGLRGAGR